jgi:hypothetical protein
VQETREATNYEIPIQLKLGAARVYDDVRMAAKCGPDIIYLDGAEGGTGAGPHIATEETGIPLVAAIPETRRALEDVGLADGIDLVVAGGIRNGADVAKALALGAKAVALGHSALMALNCNKEIPGVTDHEGTVGVPAGQCHQCHTGRCPVGVATQDPELRKRLVVEDAALRVYNFLTTLTMELQMLARAPAARPTCTHSSPKTSRPSPPSSTATPTRSSRSTPHPPRTRGRARPQGADETPHLRKQLRHPAQRRALQIPPARTRPLGARVENRRRRLATPVLEGWERPPGTERRPADWSGSLMRYNRISAILLPWQTSRSSRLGARSRFRLACAGGSGSKRATCSRSSCPAGRSC